MITKLTEQNALITLERISGIKATEIQPIILLTNFRHYIEEFSSKSNQPVYAGAYFQCAHDFKQKVTLFNINIGSPAAILIMNLLKFLKPQAVVFIGNCGGLHGAIQIGDWFIPEKMFLFHNRQTEFSDLTVEQIEAEESVNKICNSFIISQNQKCHSGNILTTDFRLWKENSQLTEWIIQKTDLQAIEMECFYLYEQAKRFSIPFTAFLLIADLALGNHEEKSKEVLKRLFLEKSNMHIEYAIKIAYCLNKNM